MATVVRAPTLRVVGGRPEPSMDLGVFCPTFRLALSRRVGQNSPLGSDEAKPTVIARGGARS